ncbi:hypothetical protein [Pseudoalteromonas luteoviolacea]|uniref:hypothetical protein n=1 Tax=Pseudoalteromonas luteoviolacea TaxID=43657 RepID=UPI001B392CC3|nr:hypothetical protein [Pseudoalteromonas luteoviolacea]MBQ4839800.1 hypothetical protein [Pseudoalteromonas luteoviolacea]
MAQKSKSYGSENGTLFVYGDESTYPPEFTFVVMNLQPDVPVYYDRKANRWWTAIADKDTDDIYARDEFYGYGSDEGEDDDIYWQPIEFKKSEVLFIPAEKSN